MKSVFTHSKNYDSKNELEPKQAQVSFDPQRAHDDLNKGLGFLSAVVGQNPPGSVGEKVNAAQLALSAALRELEKLGAK